MEAVQKSPSPQLLQTPFPSHYPEVHQRAGARQVTKMWKPSKWLVGFAVSEVRRNENPSKQNVIPCFRLLPYLKSNVCSFFIGPINRHTLGLLVVEHSIVILSPFNKHTLFSRNPPNNSGLTCCRTSIS